MRVAEFSTITGKVDSEKGIIFGVSVITKGEAKTHGTWIDDKTLRQVRSTAQTYAGGLKVKMNHYSGVDAIVGVLKNFRIDGDQLRADLHLLKSTEQYSKIVEMADKMPDSFGLSIAFSNEPEVIEKVEYARCKEIFSADLVDNPAANPSGLFAEKNDGDHDDDDAMCNCGKADCKKCMEQKKKEKMSMNIDPKQLAKALGLDPEKATEQEVSDALIARLSAKPADVTELSKKLETVTSTLEGINKAQKDAIESAKKTEISALVSEASRDGKVVPLTDVQLAKMEVADIKEMIAKLPKSQVALQRKTITAPKNDKGESLKGQELVEFNRQRKAEGAAQLGEYMARQIKDLSIN